MAIYNVNNTGHLVSEVPLFLGEQLGIHDTINIRHQYLVDLFNYLKSIDWSETADVNLDKDRAQFKKVPAQIKDIMIKNLAFQSELDSKASRAAGVLIAPFISNSELWRLDVKIQENELLHAATYTHIIKMCLDSPKEFFDEVYKNEKVTNRASVISDIFNKVQELGAKRTLGLVSDSECEEHIVKYWVAMYALERIQFMVSFAATFALAEQDYFLGIAALVQKILKDEYAVHAKRAMYVVKILQKELPHIFTKFEKALLQVVEDVVESEDLWAEYLFSEGRQVLGFNQTLAKEWVRYCTNEVLDTLGFELYDVKDNPLPYMDKWINVDKIQVAAQETQITNYKLNSYIDDTEDFWFDWNSPAKALTNNILIGD